jgi:hypothetical protein
VPYTYSKQETTTDNLLISISNDVENSSPLRGDLHIVVFSIDILSTYIIMGYSSKSPRWVTSAEVFTNSGML